MLKRLKILMLILIAICTVAAFGACSDADYISDMKDEGKLQVHLDFMGGKINVYEFRDYMVDPNGKLPMPEKKVSGAPAPLIEAPLLAGYRLDGWYTDYSMSGDVAVFDEGDRWDFDNTITDHMTLYAKWVKLFSVIVHYDKQQDNTFARSAEFLLEDTLIFNDPTDSLYWSGNTLLGYYYDAAFTQPVSFPITHPAVVGEEAFSIYSEWMVGNYTRVYKASDLKPIYPGVNYLLMNDIVFSPTDTWSAPETYRGSIEGNGFKISGIRLTVDDASAIGTAKTEFGLFGAFNGATIKNVTFEDCQVTISAREGFSKLIRIGFFAGEATNTTLTNVTLRSCKLTVTNADKLTSKLIGDVTATFSGTKTNCDFDGLVVQY